MLEATTPAERLELRAQGSGGNTVGEHALPSTEHTKAKTHPQSDVVCASGRRHTLHMIMPAPDTVSRASILMRWQVALPHTE